MTQNTNVKFLIAGAGGQHGATGNHVVRQLLARKLPVRAFVFHADQRSGGSPRLAPRSSWETCMTSRACVAQCAGSRGPTSCIHSRRGC